VSKWTCSEPYNTAYLEQTDQGLQVAPCCVADTQPYDHAVGLYDQPSLASVREQFEAGTVPDVCNYCVLNEKNGVPSRRQTCQEPVVNTVKNLEIHLGNYCNLKCVICRNRWSSAWRKDAQAMGLKTYNNFKFDPDSITADLNTVEWLHFNGGEPLFTDVHLDILARIPNPQQCSVYYNTNGTIKVKDSVFEVWSKFKLVKLVFSIDDVGDRFNYQRTNADWKQVEANMFWYRDVAPVNMMFGINRTISKLNEHHRTELDAWFAQCFPTNRLGDPNEFSEQLASGPCSLDSPVFDDYITRLDKLRQVSI
jgi:organic radical activating enzyme